MVLLLTTQEEPPQFSAGAKVILYHRVREGERERGAEEGVERKVVSWWRQMRQGVAGGWRHSTHSLEEQSVG